MKASYRWLRELVPGLEASPRELAEKLTRAGLEVEALSEFGAASKSVLVARVEGREPHPSRAKLSLVTVSIGDKTQRVVCGAPNVPEPSGLVVLAPLGTHLPAKGLTLEPREIGGVVSEGMLCSEAELGLRKDGGDHGILILPNGKPGQSLADAIPESSDTILEISLTPNRPDGLGHVGLAREIAALFGLPFEIHRAKPSRVDPKSRTEDRVTVRIDALERCPRYGAALVTGVKVGPSPLGKSYRLEALGVRSISNIVDVTNLVMLELGHPIHGFDLAKVRGASIIVRRATAGEKLTTLDGAVRALDPDDLVIADAEGAVALAGVMGGAGSELGDTTSDVLVECAYFTPRGIRRSARRHGMHTESSHRFERGVDPGDVDLVLERSASMLVELAGGTAAATMPVSGQPVAAPKPIVLRKARMDNLLGLAIPMAEAKDILVRLGCRLVSEREGEQASFTPPTHRPDIGLEEDLIEEVVRVHGIDSVPTTLPAIRPQPQRNTDAFASKVKEAAVAVGLSEALTFAFVSRGELEALRAPAPTMVLENPLSEDRNVMRTSLLPGLVEAAKRSRRHGVPNVRLFTLGSRFLPTRAHAPLADAKLPHEAPSFAALIAGDRESVLHKPEPLDVFDAKGIAVEIAERVTRRRVTATTQPNERRSPHLHPRGAGDLLVEDTVVGSFGPLHPEVERALDLGGEAFVVELDLEALETIGSATPRYRPIPSLPASTRDLALVVHDDVAAGTVTGLIREIGAELCESVELFDLFRGGSVPKEHRSLAFHVVYRDPKAALDPANARTLTDAEVDARHALVVASVTERFGAVLRA